MNYNTHYVLALMYERKKFYVNHTDISAMLRQVNVEFLLRFHNLIMFIQN